MNNLYYSFFSLFEEVAIPGGVFDFDLDGVCRPDLGTLTHV